MRIFYITLAIFICLHPAMVTAGLTENIQNILIIVKSEKRAYVEKNMQLSPEESEMFWPVYDEYQEALEEINEEYILFIWANVEDAVILSNDKAQKTIKEFLDIDNEKIELKRAFAERFGEVLPPGKLIRYYQLENRAETFVNTRLEEKIPLLE